MSQMTSSKRANVLNERVREKAVVCWAQRERRAAVSGQNGQAALRSSGEDGVRC